MAMTLEQVRDALRASHDNCIGKVHDVIHIGLLSAWADAIDAHLSAQAKVRVTDGYGEAVTQKIDKALGELSNAMEDVETGKAAVAVLSFLREAREYMRSAREDVEAIESLAARLSQGAQGDPLAGAAAEVLELERQCALDAEREKGLSVARKGVQHLFVDDAYPPDTIPDNWSDKPFARVQWTQEDGDPSVGMRGWAGWTLAADQKGTMVGALAEFCRTDPENWERFNDLYNQTHEVP